MQIEEMRARIKAFASSSVPSFFSGTAAAAFAALLLGALGAAGFAPFSFPAALAASTAGLFWLAAAAAKDGRILRGAILGLAWGAAYFSLGLSWTYHSMHVYGGVPAVLAALGVVALALLLSLVPAAVCAAACAIRASRAATLVLILPGLWCLGELFRGSWVMGFGWLSTGYAWSGTLFDVWAPVWGVYGTGLVVNVLIGTILVLLAPYDKKKVVLRSATAIFAGGLVLGTFALGLVKWSAPAGSIEVRLVQPDLPIAMGLTPKMQEQRAARVLAMSSRSALGGALDLIVWPEGVFGYPVQRLGAKTGLMPLTAAQATGAAVLYNGFGERAPGAGVTNSLWLARAAGEGATAQPAQEIYQKHHLVPFGEFIPLGFGWFVRALGIPMADQTRGPVPSSPALVIEGAQGALSICYENMFGEELRRWWDAGDPQFIVNVANLGWFAPRVTGQFTAMSAMRARETARPFIEVINNAGSALIGPDGRVEREAASGAQNLDLKLTLYKGPPTWFVRFGNVPAAAAAVIFLALGAVLAMRRRRADARKIPGLS